MASVKYTRVKNSVLNGDTQTLLRIMYLALEGVMGSVLVIFRSFLPTGKGRGRGTELGGKFLEGPGDLEVTVRFPATSVIWGP